MRLLGIDYGTKNVGIALSDEDQTQAFPRAVLHNDKELVEKIKQICKEEEVEAVIVGESLDFKGEDNPLMKRIRKFVDLLEKETALDIYTEPEYLTSEQAKRLQGNIQKLDASAAALILQSYIDKKKNKSIIL